MSNNQIRFSSTPVQRWLLDHGDALYRYAIQRVRDSHTAEDLVQETFLAAMQSAQKFAGRSTERTWLIGIIKHKLIDHLRKAVRQELAVGQQSQRDFDPFNESGHWKVRVSKWHGDPCEIAENQEFQKVLASCLSKLPPRIAHVFWLYEAESTNSNDLCQELEITPTNLWAMLHRARIGLQRCLSVNWFESDGRQ